MSDQDLAKRPLAPKNRATAGLYRLTSGVLIPLRAFNGRAVVLADTGAWLCHECRVGGTMWHDHSRRSALIATERKGLSCPPTRNARLRPLPFHCSSP